MGVLRDKLVAYTKIKEKYDFTPEDDEAFTEQASTIFFRGRVTLREANVVGVRLRFEKDDVGLKAAIGRQRAMALKADTDGGAPVIEHLNVAVRSVMQLAYEGEALR